MRDKPARATRTTPRRPERHPDPRRAGRRPDLAPPPTGQDGPPFEPEDDRALARMLGCALLIGVGGWIVLLVLLL